MAGKKQEDLTPNKQVKLVTMYGTKNSRFHAPGEETQVHPDMVEHFKSRGLSVDPPEDEEDDEDGGDEGDSNDPNAGVQVMK